MENGAAQNLTHPGEHYGVVLTVNGYPSARTRRSGCMMPQPPRDDMGNRGNGDVRDTLAGRATLAPARSKCDASRGVLLRAVHRDTEVKRGGTAGSAPRVTHGEWGGPRQDIDRSAGRGGGFSSGPCPGTRDRATKGTDRDAASVEVRRQAEGCPSTACRDTRSSEAAQPRIS